jgi:hypothetical protein
MPTPGIWYNLRPTPGSGAGSPNSTGILAQEKYSGESLLFLRKEAEFRQRPEPLSEGDAPALEPEPAEGPHPGRYGNQACLGLRLVPEGFQSAEGPCDEPLFRRRGRLAPADLRSLAGV